MHTIFLAAGGSPQGGGMGGTLVLFGLMFAVMYFFMIRPQTRRAKQQKEYRESLGKGDKIVTIGGINARITEVGETYFIIDSEGTRLRIDKTAVSMEASQPLKPKEDKEKK